MTDVESFCNRLEGSKRKERIDKIELKFLICLLQNIQCLSIWYAQISQIKLEHISVGSDRMFGTAYFGISINLNWNCSIQDI